MIASDATQALPLPTWTDPRIHLLDDSWLLTIFAMLLATALPWLVSGFDIDFVKASLGLLALGAMHVAFVVMRRPVRIGERRPLLSALHIAGVFVVGFVWWHVGGLQNPAFLMVFALPIVGAIFLSRWQPYVMALVAVSIVGLVALIQAPELRWYVPGLSSGTGLALFSQGSMTIPFAGFYAPSSYFLVLFEVFAIFIFASAVAAEYLGTIFERLHTNIDVALDEALRGQEFWATLIESLPLPALLVDVATLQIVYASGPAAEFSSSEIVSGQRLFDTLHFSYPEMVQTLFTEAAGGVAPLCMVRVGDRLRPTAVHVQHVAQKGRHFTLLLLQDRTDEFTTSMALDVTGQAVIVIDSQARIVAFNKPARALFARIDKNAEASALLALDDFPQRWWESGLTGRRKMQIEIGPRIYEVTSTAAALPGEEERLHIVTFQPVARASPTSASAALGVSR